MHRINNLNNNKKEKHKLRKSSLVKNEIKEEDRKNKTFYEEIQYISKGINNDINECNAKEAKDIIILIDFNIYTNSENKRANIDAFISQTKIILDNYLSPKDRFSLFIYTNH